MELRLTPKQSQNLKIEQSLSLKQILLSNKSIENLRLSFYPPKRTSQVLDNLLQQVLESIQDQELKDLAKNIINLEDLKECMVKSASTLSTKKKENIDTFVYDYLFDCILKIENEEEGFDVPVLDGSHRQVFSKAFKDRENLLNEIDVLSKTLSDSKSDSTLREFKARKKILEIIDSLQKLPENITHIISLLLNIRDSQSKDQENLILMFLRETVIQEELTGFSSERLLKRFLYQMPAFYKRNEFKNCKNLKNRTMNLIGEFILIGLGIIDPKMFTLYKFELDPKKVDNLMHYNNITNDELVKLFNYYNLRGLDGKPIFYNRWFTKNQLPTKESDLLIKDFIQNLKNHSKVILESFGYKDFENKVIDIKRNTSLDKEEKNNQIVEELSEKLNNEDFINTIISFLARYKYKEIYNLIN